MEQRAQATSSRRTWLGRQGHCISGGAKPGSRYVVSLFARAHVPEPHRLVIRPRGQRLAVRRKGKTRQPVMHSAPGYYDRSTTGSPPAPSAAPSRRGWRPRKGFAPALQRIAGPTSPNEPKPNSLKILLPEVVSSSLVRDYCPGKRRGVECLGARRLRRPQDRLRF